MNGKTISMKIKTSISKIVLSELIMYNLGINSSFEFEGLNYKINGVNGEEVEVLLENNAGFYFEGNYREPIKNLNISKGSSVKISNLMKPTSSYEIEILEIKNEMPRVFM